MVEHAPTFGSSEHHLIGASSAWGPDTSGFGEGIATDDSKTAFFLRHARGRSVLDVGCVQHDPANYQSKYWLHKALASEASSIVGLDLYQPGVDYLVERGFNIRHGDACNYDLGRTFDVIAAGDIVEHLGNIDGFLSCSRRHMHAASTLVVSTPNPWYWRPMVKALLADEVSNNPEHTCWYCPRTFRQLAARHGIKVDEIQFGSRYAKDRYAPLPRRWRHTSFYLACSLER